MAKIIKNTTGSAISVIDVGSIPIAAGGSYTITPEEYPLWASSTAVVSYINAGTLVVNDGVDDLKPVLGLRHLQEESVPRNSAFATTGIVQATTNSTLTLTASSALTMIFTGTTAGQIVKLPNATTLNKHWRYEIWNTSNQTVTIQNNAGTALFAMAASQKTWALLQDNATSNGTWLFEANFLGGTGSGSGPMTFGFDGSATSGRWLETSTNIASNLTPYTFPGSKTIRAIAFGGVIPTTYTATATIFKNGVSLDTITLTAQNRNTKLNLSHSLVNLDYINVQVTSGSVTRPVVTLWL
jgi:hypothetical protein